MIRPGDSKRNMQSDPTAMAEVRRTNKPLMEKRRRARINQSLQALKLILVNTKNVVNADGSIKYAKLEKADILEKTVRHFQLLKTFEQPELDKYASGFADCVREVIRYLGTPDIHTGGIIDLSEESMRIRLLKHLYVCVQEVLSNGDNAIENPFHDLLNCEIDELFDNKKNNNAKSVGECSKTSAHSSMDYTSDDQMSPNYSIKEADPYHAEAQIQHMEITSMIDHFNSSSSNECVARKIQNLLNLKNEHENLLKQELCADDSDIALHNNNTIPIHADNSMPPLSVRGKVVFLLPGNYLKATKYANFHEQTDRQMFKSEFATSDENGIKFEDVLKKTWNIEDNIFLNNERARESVQERSNVNDDEPLDYSYHSLNLPWTTNDPMWRPW